MCKYSSSEQASSLDGHGHNPRHVARAAYVWAFLMALAVAGLAYMGR